MGLELPLPLSPRRRRRLLLTAGLLGLCGVVALVVVLVPAYSGKTKEHFTEAPVQKVPRDRQVPLPTRSRHEIGKLLDAFVIDVIERRDLAAGLRLAGPPLLAGTTRREWLAGNVPVYPYPARGTHFADAWRLEVSLPDHVYIELDLQPRAGAKVGPIAYSGELRRRRGRWQVDAMYPQAIHSQRG